MQKFSFDSGIYMLELFMFKPARIEIGARGKEVFPPGYYYYTGTAQKNLNARLERHCSDDKNSHWHIDYLLDEAVIQDVFAWPEDAEWECRLAEKLLEREESRVVASGFGASDCSCSTHLVFFNRQLSRDFIEEVIEV